jgi:ADP-heptose:LPS heptosyltransferase
MLSAGQWAHVFRDNLRPDHRTFVFLGGPGDKARGEEIITELRRELPRLTFINRCGELSLRQSAGVLFESTEFWGIDSSLLHQARIAGLRCLSYWGPTDPATRLRSTWEIEEKVVYRKIACSPCVHSSEAPPCHGDNRCIQGLFDPERAPLGWTPIEYPGPPV